MPLKARGGVRDRGRSRGGAAIDSSAIKADEEQTPQVISEAGVGASTPSLVTDHQGSHEDDFKPSIDNPNAVTVDSAASASATATHNADSEPSTGPVVQGLGSLQGAIPPSRSTSSSVRGRAGITRGKKVIAKPTFTGRRSKEEREALAKEQRDRDSVRNAERDAAMKRREQDEANKAKREAKHALRARGGYSGAMTGPFSMGSSAPERKPGNWSGTSSGFGSGTGSRAIQVKQEGGGNSGPSYRSGGGGGGGGGSFSMKEVGGGFASSEEEEDDVNFPRKDIDHIEILSDEHESTPNVAPRQRQSRAALPVRIGRKEHQERTFGINTEASAEASATMSELAGTADQSTVKASTEQASRKGKGKAKDVGVSSVRKTFKGVWRDAEDSDAPIKDENHSGDENMVDVRYLDSTAPPPEPSRKHDSTIHDSEKDSKAKIKGIATPVMQTDEDRAEWGRYQLHLRHMKAELGMDGPLVDNDGDVVVGDDATKPNKSTVRDNNVYLFQIPPLMPDLLPRGIKKEPSEIQNSNLASTFQPPAMSETRIKVEDDGVAEVPIEPAGAPRFASGVVGQLRVRRSGRTTLDWGGTSFELMPGQGVSFLQEVVAIRIVPEKDRVVPEDAGEAISMGRVKGKFTITPDWERMLA